MLQLSDILTRAAWLYGDRIAVRQGEVVLTYTELGRRVAGLAGALRSRGLKPGDRVAVLARNSFRNLEIHLACAHAGLILVPMNIRLAGKEIEHILNLTNSRLLFLALPHDTDIDTIRWDDEDLPGDGEEYETLVESPPIEASRRARNETAQIFFTSGTTGEPKGACLTDGNLLASALDSIITLNLTLKSVWFHAPPMFHLVDAFAIWAITLVGGCHVIEHFEPAQFCAVVQKTKVTMASLPPTLLDMIVRTPDFASFDLSSLDRLSYGGAPMPEPIYRRCSSAFPCPLVQSYGTTETSGAICQQDLDDVAAGTWSNSIGKPLPHIDVKVFDDEGLPVLPGAVGEIAIAGERVMSGYWQNETASKNAFRNGYYLTGDLGSYDERGNFVILGRKKEMIISGGENVYPAEVEKVLLSHPQIIEAAVFAAPHPLWGEEVRAVVYVDERAQLNSQQIIDHCREFIGGYKVPKFVELVNTPLPKSGPGKIAKAMVRRDHLERISDAAS